MKRSRFNNKANKSGRPVDKTAYKTQRNLGVKLNQKTFLKKPNNRQRYKNQKICGNHANLFSLKKVFIINRNLLLKLKKVQYQVNQQLQIISISISQILHNH